MSKSYTQHPPHTHKSKLKYKPKYKSKYKSSNIKLNDRDIIKYCSPRIDEHGFLRRNKLRDELGSTTEIFCLLNGRLHTTDFADKIITYDKENLIKRIKILIEAEKHDMKLIFSFRDKNTDMNIYSAFIDNLYIEKAYLYAYIMYYTQYHLSKLEKQRLIDTPFNIYPYIYGKLLNYHENEIRGFYILKYILSWTKSQSKSVKSLLNRVEKHTRYMSKHIKENTKDIKKINIKEYRGLYKRKYAILKKHDAFGDFDIKYKNMKNRADKFFAKILTSRKYIKFMRDRKPKYYKFNLKELLEDSPLYTQKLIDQVKILKK